jgi:hypothetical protein
LPGRGDRKRGASVVKVRVSIRNDSAEPVHASTKKDDDEDITSPVSATPAA